MNINISALTQTHKILHLMCTLFSCWRAAFFFIICSRLLALAKELAEADDAGDCFPPFPLPPLLPEPEPAGDPGLVISPVLPSFTVFPPSPRVAVFSAPPSLELDLVSSAFQAGWEGLDVSGLVAAGLERLAAKLASPRSGLEDTGTLGVSLAFDVVG